MLDGKHLQNFLSQFDVRQLSIINFLACYYKCSACWNTDYNTCLQCRKGYYLLGTECNDLCPLGTYADEVLNKCFLCSEECKQCTGPNNTKDCGVCNTGFFRLNNGCYKTCPDGYWGDRQDYFCKRNKFIFSNSRLQHAMRLAQNVMALFLPNVRDAQIYTGRMTLEQLLRQVIFQLEQNARFQNVPMDSISNGKAHREFVINAIRLAKDVLAPWLNNVFSAFLGS